MPKLKTKQIVTNQDHEIRILKMAISEQTKRLDQQEALIKRQEEKINSLKYEVASLNVRKRLDVIPVGI